MHVIAIYEVLNTRTYRTASIHFTRTVVRVCCRRRTTLFRLVYYCYRCTGVPVYGYWNYYVLLYRGTGVNYRITITALK